MEGKLFDPRYVLAWYNPYMREVLHLIVRPSNYRDGTITRMIEALEGQGCPTGLWRIDRWQMVKHRVLTGDYLRKEVTS